MRAFTFTCEEVCPHCGADLASDSTLTVNGHVASVCDGRVVESEDTDLCLSDSQPDAVCAKCGGALPIDAVEENA